MDTTIFELFIVPLSDRSHTVSAPNVPSNLMISRLFKWSHRWQHGKPLGRDGSMVTRSMQEAHKEEVTLSHFTDDMILYMENPKDSTKKTARTDP